MRSPCDAEQVCCLFWVIPYATAHRTHTSTRYATMNQGRIKRQVTARGTHTHATYICAIYSSKFLPQPQGRLEPLILPFNPTGFIICRDNYCTRMSHDTVRPSYQDLASEMVAIIWPSYLKVGRGHYRGPCVALRPHTFMHTYSLIVLMFLIMKDIGRMFKWNCDDVSLIIFLFDLIYQSVAA